MATGGGLLQIIGYGTQDLILNGKPEVTFFRDVYRRYSSFANNQVNINIRGNNDFGSKLYVTIPKSGDLLTHLYLKYTIPSIQATYTYDKQTEINLLLKQNNTQIFDQTIYYNNSNILQYLHDYLNSFIQSNSFTSNHYLVYPNNYDIITYNYQLYPIYQYKNQSASYTTETYYVPNSSIDNYLINTDTFENDFVNNKLNNPFTLSTTIIPKSFYYIPYITFTLTLASSITLINDEVYIYFQSTNTTFLKIMDFIVLSYSNNQLIGYVVSGDYTLFQSLNTLIVSPLPPPQNTTNLPSVTSNYSSISTFTSNESDTLIDETIKLYITKFDPYYNLNLFLYSNINYNLNYGNSEIFTGNIFRNAIVNYFAKYVYSLDLNLIIYNDVSYFTQSNPNNTYTYVYDPLATSPTRYQIIYFYYKGNYVGSALLLSLSVTNFVSTLKTRFLDLQFDLDNLNYYYNPFLFYYDLQVSPFLRATTFETINNIVYSQNNELVMYNRIKYSAINLSSFLTTNNNLNSSHVLLVKISSNIASWFNTFGIHEYSNLTSPVLVNLTITNLQIFTNYSIITFTTTLLSNDNSVSYIKSGSHLSYGTNIDNIVYTRQISQTSTQTNLISYTTYIYEIHIAQNISSWLLTEMFVNYNNVQINLDLIQLTLNSYESIFYLNYDYNKNGQTFYYFDKIQVEDYIYNTQYIQNNGVISFVQAYYYDTYYTYNYIFTSIDKSNFTNTQYQTYVLNSLIYTIESNPLLLRNILNQLYGPDNVYIFRSFIYNGGNILGLNTGTIIPSYFTTFINDYFTNGIINPTSTLLQNSSTQVTDFINTLSIALSDYKTTYNNNFSTTLETILGSNFNNVETIAKLISFYKTMKPMYITIRVSNDITASGTNWGLSAYSSYVYIKTTNVTMDPIVAFLLVTNNPTYNIAMNYTELNCILYTDYSLTYQFLVTGNYLFDSSPPNPTPKNEIISYIYATANNLATNLSNYISSTTITNSYWFINYLQIDYMNAVYDQLTNQSIQNSIINKINVVPSLGMYLFESNISLFTQITDLSITYTTFNQINYVTIIVNSATGFNNGDNVYVGQYRSFGLYYLANLIITNIAVNTITCTLQTDLSELILCRKNKYIYANTNTAISSLIYQSTFSNGSLTIVINQNLSLSWGSLLNIGNKVIISDNPPPYVIPSTDLLINLTITNITYNYQETIIVGTLDNQLTYPYFQQFATTIPFYYTDYDDIIQTDYSLYDTLFTTNDVLINYFSTDLTDYLITTMWRFHSITYINDINADTKNNLLCVDSETNSLYIFDINANLIDKATSINILDFSTILITLPQNISTYGLVLNNSIILRYVNNKYTIDKAVCNINSITNNQMSCSLQTLGTFLQLVSKKTLYLHSLTSPNVIITNQFIVGNESFIDITLPNPILSNWSDAKNGYIIGVSENGNSILNVLQIHNIKTSTDIQCHIYPYTTTFSPIFNNKLRNLIQPKFYLYNPFDNVTVPIFQNNISGNNINIVINQDLSSWTWASITVLDMIYNNQTIGVLQYNSHNISSGVTTINVSVNSSTVLLTNYTEYSITTDVILDDYNTREAMRINTYYMKDSTNPSVVINNITTENSDVITLTLNMDLSALFGTTLKSDSYITIRTSPTGSDLVTLLINKSDLENGITYIYCQIADNVKNLFYLYNSQLIIDSRDDYYQRSISSIIINQPNSSMTLTPNSLFPYDPSFNVNALDESNIYLFSRIYVKDTQNNVPLTTLIITSDPRSSPYNVEVYDKFSNYLLSEKTNFTNMMQQCYYDLFMNIFKKSNIIDSGYIDTSLTNDSTKIYLGIGNQFDLLIYSDSIINYFIDNYNIGNIDYILTNIGLDIPFSNTSLLDIKNILKQSIQTSLNYINQAYIAMLDNVIVEYFDFYENTLNDINEGTTIYNLTVKSLVDNNIQINNERLKNYYNYDFYPRKFDLTLLNTELNQLVNDNINQITYYNQNENLLKLVNVNFDTPTLYSTKRSIIETAITNELTSGVSYIMLYINGFNVAWNLTINQLLVGSYNSYPITLKIVKYTVYGGPLTEIQTILVTDPSTIVNLEITKQLNIGAINNQTIDDFKVIYGLNTTYTITNPIQQNYIISDGIASIFNNDIRDNVQTITIQLIGNIVGWNLAIGNQIVSNSTINAITLEITDFYYNTQDNFTYLTTILVSLPLTIYDLATNPTFIIGTIVNQSIENYTINYDESLIIDNNYNNKQVMTIYDMNNDIKLNMTYYYNTNLVYQGIENCLPKNKNEMDSFIQQSNIIRIFEVDLNTNLPFGTDAQKTIRMNTYGKSLIQQYNPNYNDIYYYYKGCILRADEYAEIQPIITLISGLSGSDLQIYNDTELIKKYIPCLAIITMRNYINGTTMYNNNNNIIQDISDFISSVNVSYYTDPFVYPDLANLSNNNSNELFILFRNCLVTTNESTQINNYLTGLTNTYPPSTLMTQSGSSDLFRNTTFLSGYLLYQNCIVTQAEYNTLNLLQTPSTLEYRNGILYRKTELPPGFVYDINSDIITRTKYYNQNFSNFSNGFISLTGQLIVDRIVTNSYWDQLYGLYKSQILDYRTVLTTYASKNDLIMNIFNYYDHQYYLKFMDNINGSLHVRNLFDQLMTNISTLLFKYNRLYNINEAQFTNTDLIIYNETQQQQLIDVYEILTDNIDVDSNILRVNVYNQNVNNYELSLTKEYQTYVSLLPTINSINNRTSNLANFAWIHRLGFYMIDYFEFYIDNQTIDRQYGEWMNIWYEVSNKIGTERSVQNMIGDTSELTTFNNSAKPQTTLYIPLNLWFTRKSGLSLPLISLVNSNIHMFIKLRTLEECCYHDKNVNIKYLTKPKSYLNATLIYLDLDERRKFAESKLDYLIEQVQYNGEKELDVTQTEIPINLTNAVKDIYWVLQMNKSVDGTYGEKQYYNYTDSMIINESMLSKTKTIYGNPILSTAYIKTDGKDRVGLFTDKYYNYVQPYECYDRVPMNGINVYSFALYPCLVEPSGTMNFSMINNAKLIIETSNVINSTNKCKIRIYGRAYNVLRIASGMGGLIFMN